MLIVRLISTVPFDVWNSSAIAGSFIIVDLHTQKPRKSNGFKFEQRQYASSFIFVRNAHDIFSTHRTNAKYITDIMETASNVTVCGL